MKKSSIFKAVLNHDFFIVNKRIVLSPDYMQKIKPKKLTGSRFGTLFDSQTAQIKTWMQMFNLYSEPFDEIYSNTGQTIEPKLRDYYCELTHSQYLVYDPKKINWDVFNDNPIFGGIPDGEPLNQNTQIDYTNNKRMIEIKTASIDAFLFKKENGFFYMQKESNGLPIVKTPNGKYASWMINQKIVIPNNYLFQLSLYMYLRQIQHGAFVIGFVPTKNYLSPKTYNVQQNEIHIVNYNLELSNFQIYIDYATNWWKTYIETGISPLLSEDDLIWLNEAYDLN